MVNPVSWFAVLIMICVGTVPDMPILNSIVFSVFTLLLTSGDVMVGTLVYWTGVVDSARLLPAAFASLLFASLFAALRVPAMPYAVFVGSVRGIALVGPCPHLARFQSIVLVSLLVMMTMLVATCAVAGKRPWLWMLGCGAAATLFLLEFSALQGTSAATACTFDLGEVRQHAAAASAAALGLFGMHAFQEASAAIACKFVLRDVRKHAAEASAAALHLFGFLVDLVESAASAFEYIFCEVRQHAAEASAAAFPCDCSVILSENDKSELAWSCAGVLIFLRSFAGKSGMLELVDHFMQFGQGKGKRFSLAKISSKQDVLQASIPEALIQEASCDESCQHDTFKGWDGHSIDGSLSRDKGQASGRVDVPVDATAMIFDNVDVAPLHRSSQSVVLVNLGSHVEKIMKTVFVKGVDGKTKVRRVSDTTQIWEVLEPGIDVWVAVNGKRVEKDATMAQIGIQDQDTVRCYGRLLGGAQRYRQPPQDIPGQWTCSLCGQERVWPTKNRCFRCGNPKHQDPVSPGPVIGPTGRAPQKVPATNPTYRRDGRQNKISGQHVPSVVPPRQSLGENGGAGSNAPWAPGVRVDLVRELLKSILSNEDYEKYSAQLEPPKREEPTIYQDLANKLKEHGKVLGQVEHHRGVVKDAQQKLQKHEGFLKELLDRSQVLQQEITSLQEQVDADKASADALLPPMPPPSFPPADTVAESTVEVEELQEDDEEMEEVEESDNGGGVGAFLAPKKKKMVKKTLLKKASAKNGFAKPETRSSVFARAGALSARELTRLAEECVTLAKQKDDEELAGGVPREVGLTIEENTQLSLSG